MAALTQESIIAALQARFGNTFKTLADIPNPELLHDGLKAAKRIAQAVKAGEAITIVGDYDVDGVCSTAIMVEFFRLIGYPVEAIIPNRFRDGYGISAHLLERISPACRVIITVDNGINAIEAAKLCKERGIDLIISDHHTPSEILPDAYALIDPKLSVCPYPFKEICGAQVGWLLLNLVKRELGADIDMRIFFDLLAIAIIADVMPLLDINRVVVQKGLEFIPRSSRPAMQAIMMHFDKERISSEDIAFQIAPRINAAGRMEDASYALAFLTAPTLDAALHAFDTLSKLNTYRKDIEANSTERAIAEVNPDDTLIVVAMENLHEGVVGIIASRLVAKFEKPAIVLNIEGQRAKGSGRSIGEVDLYSLLQQSSRFLDKFGGHKMAAGLSLSVDNLHAFRAAVNEAAQMLPKSDFIPVEECMGELYPEMIDFHLLEAIERFEPFGEANLRPKFIMKETAVQNIRRMGEKREHLRFTVAAHHLSENLTAVAFRNATQLEENRRYSFSYTLNKNSFRGSVSIQLMLDRIWTE